MKRVCCCRYMFGFGFGAHSNNVVQRFYSTSSSSSSTSDLYAKYLVDSLGFSQQQATSTCTRVYHHKKMVNAFKFHANADSVVAFFKERGFDDTRLRKLVSSEPRLLSSNVHKTIQPKLLFLQQLGFSGPDIIRVISVNPFLLRVGLESCIVPAVNVLKEVMVSHILVLSIFKRICSRDFNNVIKYLLPNVALLMSYGVPIESIRKHFLKHPSAFLLNSEIFKDKVIRVEKKLGITPSMLLYGIKLVCCYSEETIESKCRVFKSFGWTQIDVEKFIMKNAQCFSRSDETIKKKLDFLMNELRLTPAYLTSHSTFLTYSLEKTIVPRHKVLLILKEKCLLKKDPTLGSICMPEPRFFKRFILPFEEVHQVYVELTGRNMKMPTQDSAYNLE